MKINIVGNNCFVKYCIIPQSYPKLKIIISICCQALYKKIKHPLLKKKKRRNLKKFNPSEMLKQKASRKCVHLHDKERGIWNLDWGFAHSWWESLRATKINQFHIKSNWASNFFFSFCEVRTQIIIYFIVSVNHLSPTEWWITVNFVELIHSELQKIKTTEHSKILKVTLLCIFMHDFIEPTCKYFP